MQAQAARMFLLRQMYTSKTQ